MRPWHTPEVSPAGAGVGRGWAAAARAGRGEDWRNLRAYEPLVTRPDPQTSWQPKQREEGDEPCGSGSPRGGGSSLAPGRRRPTSPGTVCGPRVPGPAVRGLHSSSCAARRVMALQGTGRLLNPHERTQASSAGASAERLRGAPACGTLPSCRGSRGPAPPIAAWEGRAPALWNVSSDAVFCTFEGARGTTNLKRLWLAEKL